MIQSKWPWLAIWVCAACGSSANQPIDADVIVDARVRLDAPDEPLADARLLDASELDAPLAIDARVPPDGPPPAGETRIRLVAGNITSGNGQAYELPGIRIFQGLAPDVAMIQELNYNLGTATIRSLVDQAFGPEYQFVRGAATQQIPNGVVSRYPIIASGEWVDPKVSNRDFVWARIDVPGPIDLFAISVHLLTANAGVRDEEAAALVQNIQGLPANAYVVLGGDFNTDARTEAAIGTLSAVLTTSGPFPVDLNGSSNTNANRNKPYDWVLASPSLDALETPTVIGSHQLTDGFVADTRVYTPISDLAPALANDSGADMMQHMAIVRDFVIPGSAAPSLTVTAPNGGEVWQVGTSHAVTWTSSGVGNVRVELVAGAMTFTIAASVPAVDGQIALTVPPAVTDAAFARVTEVGGSLTDSSDAPFRITMVPPPAGRVLINEVLANEPGTDPVGEFIELVNIGSSDVDLAGWTLSDSAAVRHTFPAGSVLAAGRALAVFGGAAGIPSGVSNAVIASSGTLGLSNSGDTVTLASPTGSIDTVTYTSVLSGTDGVSMNRSTDADPAAAFVLHTTLVSAHSSPGVRVSGAAF